MIEKFNYNNKCWWCGNDANSREHRFKKTDLEREFGKGSYIKGDVVKTKGNFDIKGGLPIQSANSIYLKYSNNLCQKCNNTKSQPFDRAYDIFIKYLLENELIIFETHFVNLRKVYGDNWKLRYRELICYFIKNVSSRLADINIRIDDNIINFLNGLTNLNSLNIILQIRTDMVEFYKFIYKKNEQYSYLNASGIYGNQSKSLGTYYSLKGIIQYNWFQIFYIYDDQNIYEFYFDDIKELINLQESFNLDPTEFKEFMILNETI